MTISNLETVTAVWIQKAESRYWRFEAAGEELGGVDVTAGDVYWAYVGDGEAEPIASSHSLEKMKCLVEDTVRR